MPMAMEKCWIMMMIVSRMFGLFFGVELRRILSPTLFKLMTFSQLIMQTQTKWIKSRFSTSFSYIFLCQPSVCVYICHFLLHGRCGGITCTCTCTRANSFSALSIIGIVSNWIPQSSGVSQSYS